jgi:hypothetical protein
MLGFWQAYLDSVDLLFCLRKIIAGVLDILGPTFPLGFIESALAKLGS